MEVHEFRVAGEDLVELRGHLRALAGQQHPQILHRRAHARVVEVDEVRAVVGPQDVTGVHIAMQANAREAAGAGEGGLHLGQHVAGQAEVGLAQIVGDHPGLAQVVHRGVAKAGHIQRRPVLEGPGRAEGMDAAEEAAHPQQLVRVFQIRPAAAAARVEGEAEALVPKQGLALRIGQRRHGGDFRLGQGQGEDMLLADRRIAPAAGAVELGDQRRAVFHPHLIDAILIAVQGQQAAIAAIAGGVHGIQHRVRREGVIGVLHRGRGGVRHRIHVGLKSIR